MLTGKRRNVATKLSHSHRRSKKVQAPNVQWKRFWWEGGARFVRLRVSTSAMRTIDKKGLDVFAHEVGLDLSAY
jgi:large subunit ribosomal protein L28